MILEYPKSMESGTSTRSEEEILAEPGGDHGGVSFPRLVFSPRGKKTRSNVVLRDLPNMMLTSDTPSTWRIPF